MNRILTIFHYTVLRYVRETGDFIGRMLVFPILLIFILGMALSSNFQQPTFDPTIVGYLNGDKGAMGESFAQFLAHPEVAELLDVREVATLAEGMELLKSGEISVLIHVEPGLSQQILVGQEAMIQIIGRPGRELRVTMVESILESYVHRVNAVQALMEQGAVDVEIGNASGIIDERPVSASGLMPTAMDYYAVTMLAMFILWGSLYACYGTGENLEPIGKRVKSSPISPRELFGAQLLANIVTVFTQALVIIGFTRYVFGVNWGDDIGLIILIVFVAAALATSLGTMAVRVTGDITKATGLLNVIVVAGTFVSGGYFPVNFPGILSYVQYLSPNFLAQTAIFNTIYGGTTWETMAMMAAMVLIIAAAFAIAMAAERKSVQ